MYDPNRTWAPPPVDSDEIELERLKRLNEEVEIELQDRFAVIDGLRGKLIIDPDDLERLQETQPAPVVRQGPTPTALRC